jgi:hypothetical protein
VAIKLGCGRIEGWASEMRKTATKAAFFGSFLVLTSLSGVKVKKV